MRISSAAGSIARGSNWAKEKCTSIGNSVWGRVCNIASYLTLNLLLILSFQTSVLWSRDQGLESREHSSLPTVGLGLGLDTIWVKSRSWSQDLASEVLNLYRDLAASLEFSKSTLVIDSSQICMSLFVWQHVIICLAAFVLLINTKECLQGD